MASFQSQFYDPATAPVIDRAGGFVVSGDRFNGVVLPGDEPTDEALQDFPQLANLQRLYHGVPNGFSETPKDGWQPRLGMAYAINETMTFRAGVGRFLNRVQINTTAAYGFNAPLSDMQTVINGVVDSPGGASTRNFPLVGAMQSPDFTNPTSWSWNATLDRELPWTMRGSISYVGRSATHLERARNINQLEPGTIQRNPGVNTNALRPYLGFSTVTLYETTGTSRYNSFQTQLEKRATRAFGFNVAYTFSRTTDDGAGRNDLLPDAFDDSGYYGISDLDRPHVLITSARYRFPTLESSVAPLRWVFGNWDVSGVLQAQSGAPFDVRSPGIDLAGRARQRQPVVRSDRRSRSDPENRVGAAPDIGPRRDLVRPERVQGARNGHVRHDAGKELDPPTRLLGREHVGPQRVQGGQLSQRFDFRMEAFNVLNRARLGNAVTNPTSGDFGFIVTRRAAVRCRSGCSTSSDGVNQNSKRKTQTLTARARERRLHVLHVTALDSRAAETRKRGG